MLGKHDRAGEGGREGARRDGEYRTRILEIIVQPRAFNALEPQNIRKYRSEKGKRREMSIFMRAKVSCSGNVLLFCGDGGFCSKRTCDFDLANAFIKMPSKESFLLFASESLAINYLPNCPRARTNWPKNEPFVKLILSANISLRSTISQKWLMRQKFLLFV